MDRIWLEEADDHKLCQNEIWYLFEMMLRKPRTDAKRSLSWFASLFSAALSLGSDYLFIKSWKNTKFTRVQFHEIL